jgi:hypothetical protein
MFQKLAINILCYSLPSKYTKIVGIGVGKRYLLIFFFIPIPTQHPKGVQMGLARKKKTLGFNEEQLHHFNS